MDRKFRTTTIDKSLIPPIPLRLKLTGAIIGLLASATILGAITNQINHIKAIAAEDPIQALNAARMFGPLAMGLAGDIIEGAAARGNDFMFCGPDLGTAKGEFIGTTLMVEGKASVAAISLAVGLPFREVGGNGNVEIREIPLGMGYGYVTELSKIYDVVKISSSGDLGNQHCVIAAQK